jgi:hypothetical protein
MNTHRTDRSIDNLQRAFNTAFILDEVMTNSQISHVLRIRVVGENPEDVWRPVPLPL